MRTANASAQLVHQGLAVAAVDVVNRFAEMDAESAVRGWREHRAETRKELSHGPGGVSAGDAGRDHRPIRVAKQERDAGLERLDLARIGATTFGEDDDRFAAIEAGGNGSDAVAAEALVDRHGSHQRI